MKYYINPQLEKDINTLHTFITPYQRATYSLSVLSTALAAVFGNVIGKYIASTEEFQKIAIKFEEKLWDTE